MSCTPVIRSRFALLVALSALTAAACGDDPFPGATETIGGQIVTGDQLLFEGEDISFVAQAIYVFGPGLPQAVVWTVSDPTVLEIEGQLDNSARATAVGTGETWVYALINAAFEDSVRVTVVNPGAVRWAKGFGDVPVALYPAIGADSLIRVVTGGASPLLHVLDPDDGAGPSAASCFSSFGPSLGTSDVALVSGAGCTRKHATVGGALWTAPAGNAALGVAVTADDGAVTVSTDSVFRVGAAGAVQWGQALGGAPQTVPVLGPGGDVYVGWRAGGADSVSRFAAADGALVWSAAVAGLSVGTPAVAGGRIVFGRPGGLFALDTAGTVAWDQSFPGGSPTGATSSPVHDGLVIFVQNEDALYAYAVGGTLAWAADSLGYGTAVGPVPAPVLLTDLSLVVPCIASGGTREVCAVRQTNGSLLWRSAIGGGSVSGIAVARNGILFATRTLSTGGSQLAALWGRTVPTTNGWPTEGRNPQRTRRQ